MWCGGHKGQLWVGAACVLSASDEDCGCVVSVVRVVGVLPHILDQSLDACAGLQEVFDQPIYAILLVVVIHCLGDSVGIEEKLSAWR